MKKKDKREYRVPANCFVCSKAFLARYNVGDDRAKTCTPPAHECRRKTLKIPGRRDKLITCVEGCCKSKYYKGSTLSSANASIDSRKFLNDHEYKATIAASRKIGDPAGITIRFILETGCRCGEALLVRKQYLDWKEGKLSVIRMPTLKKAGHPLLPVHLDNSGDVAKELRVWAKKFGPNDLLFKIPKRTLQYALERLLDKIKPDRASLVHILRHTRASRLVASGLDSNTIRQEMRWSSIELLKVYSHTTIDKVAEALDRIR